MRFIHRIIHRRSRPSGFSVKEGLDNLPSGICFAKRNGTVILCNRQMYRLVHTMSGRDLQHLSELDSAFDSPGGGVYAEDCGGDIYRFPDGRLWQFSQIDVVDADKNEYIQVKAIDVTELHGKRVELERDNAELEAANARARRLYAEMDELIREKETLAMKMKVHDDIGLCLLATRNLLTQGADSDVCRKVKRRWEQTLRLIGIADRQGYGENPESPSKALSELIDSAREIGLRVRVIGNLPSSERNAYLFISAMRECVTNTVRHAGGDEMEVLISQDGSVCRAVITDNGAVSVGDIVEGGGLSGLRRTVEAAGGTMSVTPNPHFRLSIEVPTHCEGVSDGCSPQGRYFLERK